MTLRALTFTTVCLILLVHLASGSWRRRWGKSSLKKPPNFEKPPPGEENEIPDRIVFGRTTSVSFYPYQLALEGGGSHICGGSILSMDWALTAAHCVYDQPLRWLTFRAGTSLREKGGTVHRVKFYVTHEKYRENTLDYDVAVVRVRDPFRYNNWTYPITLPTLGYHDSEKVVVTGWGYKQPTLLTKANKLQMAALVTLDWDKCDKLYPGQITNRMMCAEDPRHKADICSGDSGGPLVKARKREQLGIVSWSHECADGKASIYVDVFSVASWISQKVGFDDQILFEEN